MKFQVPSFKFQVPSSKNDKSKTERLKSIYHRGHRGSQRSKNSTALPLPSGVHCNSSASVPGLFTNI